MDEYSRSPTIEGLRSLEVRWILSGPLPTAMAEWFGRFSPNMESREDAYLVDPLLGGLSVKVRGDGGLFEVKVFHGSEGLLEVARLARGRMESWQKWSFPCSPVNRRGADTAIWTVVRKTRWISRFRLIGEQRSPGPASGEGEPGCDVELTDVRLDDAHWWSLGFEATGPARLLRTELDSTARLVLADAVPDGTAFETADSLSYAEWLIRGSAASNVAAPRPQDAEATGG